MEISIRPADGQHYRNGVIVGHVVPLGEVAHTIEALMGAEPKKTSGTLTRQLDEMTERLAQTGYLIAGLRRNLSAEKERADENREWAERTEERLKAETARVAELERELLKRPTVAELHEAERTAASLAEAEMKKAYEAEKDRANKASTKVINAGEFRAGIVELVNSAEVVQALGIYSAEEVHQR